ncbi:MAG: tetratricopeptide repeat protein [Myxococcales bacterium]|jgi:predicted Zn finger-like uncharacterized protein
MDVTCDRCGTVYEFEEAMIASTGTTVKCTDCGHLFKVTRTGSAADSAAPSQSVPDDGHWRVRRSDGGMIPLENLAELTRLIGDGELGRDDEISRTGRAWRRLGEVEELTPLFEARRRRPTPEGRALNLGLVRRAAGADATDPGQGSASAEPRFESMGHEVDVRLGPGAVGALEEEPTTPGFDSPATDQEPPGPPGASGAPPAAPPAPAATPQAMPPAPGPSAVPPPPSPSPPSRLWPWLLVATLATVGIGIGVVLLRPRPQPPGNEVERDPSGEFIERGDAALASHHPQRFQEAINEYTKALAFHPGNPRILSSIARSHAVWAQLLRFRLQALPADDPATEVERASLDQQARRLTEEARRHAEQAARRNPGNEEAEVALADALRLSGNLVAARAELDRARHSGGVTDAEGLRVAALLAIDEAGGELQAGCKLAEQAVARDGSLIRTRLLLARCLRERGDRAALAAQVQTLRRLAPGLPELEPFAEPKAAPRTARDASAPRTAARPTPPPRASEGGDGDGSGEPADALALIRRGEAALERGHVDAAQTLFERALRASPGQSRARTGLGYVALERSRPRQAIKHFRFGKSRGNPEAFIGLGDAYRRLGRVRDALATYRAYVKRFPGGPRRSIAERQIEILSEQVAEDARPGAMENPYQQPPEAP